VNRAFPTSGAPRDQAAGFLLDGIDSRWDESRRTSRVHAMTNVGPEKKGLGLDAIAPDEPSYLAGPAVARPRRWWLTSRSLASSIVFCALWSLYSVFRLVELTTERHTDGMDWLLLVVPSVLALWSMPSIVFFARSSHRTASADSVEPRE
jgi:hypothetical protein